MTFEFEHIMPRSSGGETVFENLCLACPFCNRHKADRQTAIDPTTGQTVPLFHPQRQNWAEHFIWNDEAIEIIDLTLIGRTTIAAFQMNRPALVRVRKMWVKLGEHPPNIPEVK